MDEDDHHGTHVLEFATAYSGAVLDQGPPPQHILAWINLFGCSHTNVVLLPNLLGSPIICCSKSDKSKEECTRSKSIINGKLNKMNYTGEEPPRRNNSSIQVETKIRLDTSISVTSNSKRMEYEATIGSLGGPDANMPMRLRATNRIMNSRFCRIQRVAKAGWLIDADYRNPVGSVIFNDLEADFAIMTGDRMFTIVSMNAANVKDGSMTRAYFLLDVCLMEATASNFYFFNS
ncbi:hypothetical protein VPH35_081063 [Triticum aestivum]